MGGVYGTQQSEEMAVFLAEFGNGIGDSLEDGKFSFLQDIANFTPALLKLVPAIEGAGQIPQELGELDSEDLANIQAKLEATFDIPQERTEAFVLDTVSMAITGQREVSLFSYIREYFTGENRIFKK